MAARDAEESTHITGITKQARNTRKEAKKVTSWHCKDEDWMNKNIRACQRQYTRE